MNVRDEHLLKSDLTGKEKAEYRRMAGRTL